MNNAIRLRDMPLSFGDLLRIATSRESLREEIGSRINFVRNPEIKPWPPIYDQSGSPIVDEYYHRITKGDCYNHLSFEIKIH